MKKFLIPLFVLSAVFLSGCSDKQQAAMPQMPEPQVQEEVQEVQESISEEVPNEMLPSENKAENSEASQNQ